MESALSIAAAVVISLGGGAAIVFGLSSWLGKVWASRILEGEKASLARAAEDRTRRIESLMKHHEKQIEEFYGPLFNMVNQIFVANEIKWELLHRDPSGSKSVKDKAAREAVEDYYHQTYFIPLHDQVTAIMRSKLYLVDGDEMPQSFYRYMKHASQERDQIALWKQHQIDTSFLKGEPWPDDFYNDIKAGFERAMKNYERCLNGLKDA
jgi:hypothetical protein